MVGEGLGRSRVKQLVLIAGASFLAHNAHAATAQFDLICSGSRSSHTLAEHDGVPTSPFSERVRVDLSAMTYCDGTCDKPKDIARVTADRIQFDNVYGGTEGTVMWVGRVTGEFKRTEISALRNIENEWIGTCVPAPYTQVPKTRF